MQAAIASSAGGDALLECLLEAMPGCLFVTDLAGAIMRINRATRELLDWSESDVAGRSVAELIPDLADGERVEAAVLTRRGESMPMMVTRRPLRDDRGAVVGTVHIAIDMHGQRHAEAELRSMRSHILTASRQAGMAEVANGILHNVGNVLNSANVSATLIAERVRDSRVATLTKIAELLDEHEHDLAEFLTADRQGARLPELLRRVADRLVVERDRLGAEVDSLQGNLSHIKSIVTTQQAYARAAGVVEIMSLSAVIDAAIELNETSFERRGITVVRDYCATEPMSLDRHRVLQILVNLLGNARHALVDAEAADKRVRVTISEDSEHYRVRVIDNGVGINDVTMKRIFEHGFTTKQGGHGFGLHASANLATEAGGSLTAHSDGTGTGATFILTMPKRPGDRS